MPEIRHMQWRIHRWYDAAPKGTTPLVFQERESCEQWLRHMQQDTFGLQVLRTLAHREGCNPLLSNADIIRQLAALFHHGVLRVAWQAPTATLFRARLPAEPQQSRAGQSATRKAVSTPTPVAKPAPEPSTFTARNDPAALAQVLQDAAGAGVPFCEECAKLAAAAAAAVEEEETKPVEPATFSAQTGTQRTAAVLREAAETGAAFCEECAKAEASQEQKVVAA